MGRFSLFLASFACHIPPSPRLFLHDFTLLARLYNGAGRKLRHSTHARKWPLSFSLGSYEFVAATARCLRAVKGGAATSNIPTVDAVCNKEKGRPTCKLAHARYCTPALKENTCQNGSQNRALTNVQLVQVAKGGRGWFNTVALVILAVLSSFVRGPVV